MRKRSLLGREGAASPLQSTSTCAGEDGFQESVSMEIFQSAQSIKGRDLSFCRKLLLERKTYSEVFFVFGSTGRTLLSLPMSERKHSSTPSSVTVINFVRSDGGEKTKLRADIEEEE